MCQTSSWPDIYTCACFPSQDHTTCTPTRRQDCPHWTAFGQPGCVVYSTCTGWFLFYPHHPSSFPSLVIIGSVVCGVEPAFFCFPHTHTCLIIVVPRHSTLTFLLILWLCTHTHSDSSVLPFLVLILPTVLVPEKKEGPCPCGTTGPQTTYSACTFPYPTADSVLCKHPPTTCLPATCCVPFTCVLGGPSTTCCGHPTCTCNLVGPEPQPFCLWTAATVPSLPCLCLPYETPYSLPFTLEEGVLGLLHAACHHPHTVLHSSHVYFPSFIWTHIPVILVYTHVGGFGCCYATAYQHFPQEELLIYTLCSYLVRTIYYLYCILCFPTHLCRFCDLCL